MHFPLFEKVHEAYEPENQDDWHEQPSIAEEYLAYIEVKPHYDALEGRLFQYIYDFTRTLRAGLGQPLSEYDQGDSVSIVGGIVTVNYEYRWRGGPDYTTVTFPAKLLTLSSGAVEAFTEFVVEQAQLERKLAKDAEAARAKLLVENQERKDLEEWNRLKIKFQK